ncbi:MAG: hypothetical protein ACI4SJ_01400 [Candidatus Avispirillum sp.]
MGCCFDVMEMNIWGSAPYTVVIYAGLCPGLRRDGDPHPTQGAF